MQKLIGYLQEKVLKTMQLELYREYIEITVILSSTVIIETE